MEMIMAKVIWNSEQKRTGSQQMKGFPPFLFRDFELLKSKHDKVYKVDFNINSILSNTVYSRYISQENGARGVQNNKWSLTWIFAKYSSVKWTLIMW